MIVGETGFSFQSRQLFEMALVGFWQVPLQPAATMAAVFTLRFCNMYKKRLG